MSKTSAFIAIVGRANVGKSSILNRLMGQKIAIVSDKPQTTRTKITGILTKGDMQLVFIDTPGLHKPRNMLGQNMVKAIGQGMSDVDCCLLVVAANEPPEQPEIQLIEKFKRRGLSAVLAINKIDLIRDKSQLLKTISEYNALFDFDAILPICAKSGEGLNALMQELERYAVPSVHYFDESSLTDQPERVIAGEMIREQLLHSLEREVPHGLAVDIEQFREREDGEILDISATIYCEKSSHKGIVIGKNGGMLKRVGSGARAELEEFFHIKINLKLWVKIKENWRTRSGSIHGFGLD